MAPRGSEAAPRLRQNPPTVVERAPELVSFRSGELSLRGVLYRPNERGRSPALIWNHGSERVPASGAELARFYGSRGYVLFLPHRRGHGESPGAYPIEKLHAGLRAEAGGSEPNRDRLSEAVVALHERYLEDTAAAVGWLGRQPFVASDRMVMSGVSHGGIQTLLAAESDLGPKAYVPFAPAAMAWDDSPALRDRLLRAARAARAPIFLLQAANDYSLGPSEILGAVLRRKGQPNRTTVYPPYGDTSQAGHGRFACEGTDVWGDDVSAFLDEVVAAPAAPRSEPRASG
jgi:dienelactone hydrolase